MTVKLVEMGRFICVWIVLLVNFTGIFGDVTVVRLQLSLEQEHSLTLNSSIEYMLDFSPNSEQMQFPNRIFLKTDGGDTTHPLLITARQRTGAVSWQLPYVSQDQVLYEMEWTLCPDDARTDLGDSECSEADAYLRRNAFTLHVSSTCIVDVSVSLLATPLREFFLPFQSSTNIVAKLAIPKVFFYQFRQNQNSVRLIMESEDEICALISIQNVTCPILQTEDQTQLTGLRFTMLQSGGVQVARSRFPSGFYVVIIVKATDTECVGEDSDDNWLQSALVWDEETTERQADRTKTITIRMEPSLTRGQYAIATGVTVTLFVLFYVLFFGVVLAQRWPWFAKYVSPKAPLAEIHLTETQLEASQSVTQSAPSRRPRRSSTATFDSSDNSDTDEDEDPPRHNSATNRTAVTTNSAANTTNSTAITSNSTSNVTVTTTAPSVTTVSSDNVTASEPIESSEGVIRVPSDEATVTDGKSLAINGNGASDLAGNGVRVESNPVRVESVRNGEIVDEGNGIMVVDGNVVQLRFNEAQLGPSGGALPHDSYRDSTPFGLPHQLNLATLSRHRARILRVRSDRYLYTLYTVAVFYALPVVQFVSAFQIVFNVSGSLDICYYNFLCSHPAGALSDFNHVFSNLGYMLLGALFMLQLRRRRMRRKRTPKNEDYGIPAHYGLLSSLGAGMMVVGVLSASYHVCPNRLNFQFDTAFMYVLAVLSMVKIYQSRHPDVNARAHATFGVLAVLIALVVWGVLGSGPFFWAMFTVLHLFTFLLLSLRIYYVGQFRLEKNTLQRAARQLAAMPKRGVRPLYRARLVMLLIANGVNWAFAIWGLWTQTTDFAGHLLQLLLLNAFIHMVFYITMKLLNKERLRWYAWLFLAGAAAAWAPALYFFLSGSSDWSATPAVSRHMNHECKVLQFYDSHDLWHMLSAVALYLSFNAMLTWDDGLAAIKRTDIAVF